MNTDLETSAETTGGLETRDMMLNIGPAHPAMHGIVRIVAQLSDRFPAWQDAPEGIHQAHLTEALSRLEALADGPSATIRNARLVAMIRLMTSSLAARAVALDSRSTPALDDPTYEGNLVDVLVGVLTAPSSLVA